MNLIFFAHPGFIGHQSMPRFTTMLADGMRKRGHQVEVWSPKPQMFKLAAPKPFKKWLGYIDQYIVFPLQVRRLLKEKSADTLFVFTDNALGPWVPLVCDRPHVIHCHDFLAQRSALGEIPENPTGWTGRQYQAYIRRGYSKGKNFISVSNKTREDLHKFLSFQPSCSKVVYNGLNQKFEPIDPVEARLLLSKSLNLNVTPGYLLHVGGNDWYKNKVGVIQVYDAWRKSGELKLPLLLIGSTPSSELTELYHQSPFRKDIHFLTGIPDETVRLAYAGAAVFLFPSLAEGFGWPIAEAMASGCPVITTNEAPMNEVAGDAGFFVSRKPGNPSSLAEWAGEVSKVINQVLGMSDEKKNNVRNAGIMNAKRFDTEKALDQIEAIYLGICEDHKKQPAVFAGYK